MIGLLFLLAAAAAEPPGAKQLFASRQEDLVALAGQLGSLHRLSQLCGTYEDMGLFREHMKAITEGEQPYRPTREAMIAAFNEEYRRTSDLHYACSQEARAALRSKAERALLTMDRLASAMPMSGSAP